MNNSKGKQTNQNNAVCLNHGIDCSCDECEKIRQLIRGKVETGEVYLVGLEEDKKKILDPNIKSREVNKNDRFDINKSSSNTRNNNNSNDSILLF